MRPSSPCAARAVSGKNTTLVAALWLCFASLLSAGETNLDKGTLQHPWQEVFQWLSGDRDRFTAALGRAHESLLARARAEEPSLVERLSLEPPRPRPTGYGLLPKLLPSKPLGTSAPRRQLYSLEELTTAYARDIRDTGLLALRAKRPASAPLEPMVTEYERLKKRLVSLQDQLNYHDFWQKEVRKSERYYARKNEILALVEQWHSLETSDGDIEQRARLHQEITDRVAPFNPTKGLVLEKDINGGWVLPVRVLTDISDEPFLESFRDAVHEAFSDSEAARASRFQVRLTIQVISPASLYPEGAPKLGSAVNERQHIARFPAGSLVLTTGAKSTHAWTGRYVQLGSNPMPTRNLAHEFGHLLGFADGYLRAYRGSPDDPYGAVVVEWKNLLDDLMGSPSRGRITPGMIEQLLEAYAPAVP